jgi:F0F1-type ATP synthase assembly protein I
MLGEKTVLNPSTIAWHWVLRLFLTVLGLAVLPVGLGILLDRRMHTSPVITLFMLLLGFNLGIYTIARSVVAMYARVEAQTRTPQHLGGDQC